MSSVQRTIEQFLSDRPFERGPWLAVGFGAGIVVWATLPGPWQWLAFLALCGAVVTLALLILPDATASHTRLAAAGMALMLAAGCATVWMKSAAVGMPPIAERATVMLAARIRGRQDGGGTGRVHLLLAARIAGTPGSAPAIQARVLVPPPLDRPDLVAGAVITARARLAPPAPPLLPGARDEALVAWFSGLSATGTIAGAVTVTSPVRAPPSVRGVQDWLHAQVMARVHGSAGGIAATLASGDRGGVVRGDAHAMRDAGLAHLLVIGGLHVSAVIALVYALVLRGLALIPWIALRVRLPVVAAVAGAIAGIAYCLITGAQVPTLRAVAGAVLVLGALALGRDPLSMRLLAVAALLVMVFWPEAVLGPSFQMSFAAVAAIIALHNAGRVRAFLAWRDESGLIRLARRVVMLVIGGLAIEAAVAPVALYHFHRAGLYGAFANLVAIPLTTVVTMPAIGLGLVLDCAGLGAPAWWVTGQSLHMLLAIAHATAAMPGAVAVLPAMPGWVFGLWMAGLMWLVLWTGRVRLWGLAPIALAVVAYAVTPVPDILIAGDGHHVGITGLGPDLILLRSGAGAPVQYDVVSETMVAMAGMTGTTRSIETWPGARCGHDFCALALDRKGRHTVLLLARSHRRIDEGLLARACAQSDIVIADHPLPASCHPRQLLVDGGTLTHTGGITIDLGSGNVRTVAATTGRHPWTHWPGL